MAVGYNYAVVSGPAFASVVVPDQFSDTMFTVEFAGCGGFCSIDISAEEVFDFTTFEFGGSVLFPDGVTQFRIVGIDPDLMLDPTADNVFVTGLTFVDNGQTTADVTMSAITQFVDDSQSGGNQGGGSVTIPEPASLSLSLVGLAALWRVRRRRRVAA